MKSGFMCWPDFCLFKDSGIAKIGFYLASRAFNTELSVSVLFSALASCLFQFIPADPAAFLSRLQSVKLVLFGLAFMIACADAYQFHVIEQADLYRVNYFVPFNLCMGLAFVCWIVQLQHQQSQYQPVWPQSANFSYTLYVTHFPLLLFILGCFPATLNHGLEGAVLSLFMSMCSLIFFAWLMAQWLEPQRKSVINYSAITLSQNSIVSTNQSVFRTCAKQGSSHTYHGRTCCNRLGHVGRHPHT